MFQVSIQPTSWCLKLSRLADSAFNCTEKCFAFSWRSRVTWHRHSSRSLLKKQAHKALSTCSSLATFRDFGLNPLAVLNLSVNFRIFSWFLHISETYCLPILNLSAKFVPFSPFSKHKKIVSLSFNERTDHFIFIDITVI